MRIQVDLYAGILVPQGLDYLGGGRAERVDPNVARNRDFIAMSIGYPACGLAF